MLHNAENTSRTFNRTPLASILGGLAGQTILSRKLGSVAILFIVALACGQSALCRQSFTGLGYLGTSTNLGTYSHAFAVSWDGSVIVGASTTTDGQHAFRWSPLTGMVAIGDLTGDFVGTVAYSVSADGTSIAGSGTTTIGSRAVLWQGTEMLNLGILPDSNGESHYGLVSGDGQVVVGYATSVSGSQIFRWTQATGMVGIGQLPSTNPGSHPLGVSYDGNVIVGSSIDMSGNDTPIRWEADKFYVLGCLEGSAGLAERTSVAATPSGELVIGYCNGPFLWTEGKGVVRVDSNGPMQDFRPFAMNGDGSIIVGKSIDSNIAVIWDAKHNTRDLKHVLESEYGLELHGWSLEMPLGVSGDGTMIVGFGTNPCGLHEAWAARIDGGGLPPPPIAPCEGDINWDGVVSFDDLALILSLYGTAAQCADLNRDGIVDFQDFSLVLRRYGFSC